MTDAARFDLLPLDCRRFRVVQLARQNDTVPGVPVFHLVDPQTGASMFFGTLTVEGARVAVARGAHR